MITAYLLLACCQEVFVDDEYAFKLTPPTGWDRKSVVREGTPVAALWVRPSTDSRSKDAPPDFTVRRIMTGWPSSMEELQGNVSAYLKEHYTDGFKELWRSEEKIGGMPAVLFGAEVRVVRRDEDGKVIGSVDRFIAHGLIQRTLLEHFIIHLSAPPDEADTYRRVYEEAVRSFGSLEMTPTAEQLAAERRFTDLRPLWADSKNALAFDDWFNIQRIVAQAEGAILKEKKGYYHIRTREADVEGEAGISFETRLDLVNLEGAKVVTETSGAFRYNLSFQRATSKETFTDAQGRVTRRHEITARTAAGGFAVTRTVQWGDRTFKEEKTVTVPAGTVLTNVQEILRRSLAARGRNDYFSRVLYMAEDRVRYETLRVFDVERIEIRGEKHDVRPVHTQREYGATVQYEFSTDGSLLREHIGIGTLLMDRTTEEDALKPATIEAPPKKDE